MKLKYTKPTSKGFTLVELLVVMAIIAVLASIATPLVLNKRRDADRTKAIAHAKQILIAITEFENDQSTRPGEQIVSEANVDSAAAGTANDCFRQLLQNSPTVRSEAIFYAPSLLSKQPDNDIGSSPAFANAIDQGENGFLYMDNPRARDGAPICLAPLVEENGSKFDFQAYNGKAVVLKTDGSVDTPAIDEDTEEIEIKIDGSDVGIISAGNTTFRDAPNPKPIVPR